MDTVLILQVAFLFAVFIVCFLSVLLPVKFTPHNVQGISEKSKCILSFSNCFAGGVFLGTCFLQLIPFIEDKLNYVFYNYGVNLIYTCPVTQVLVIIGFFMILVIEQSVRVCQSGHSLAMSEPLQFIKVQGESMSSDVESDDSTAHGGSENKHMLRRKKLKRHRSHNRQEPSKCRNKTASHITEVSSTGVGPHEDQDQNLGDIPGHSHHEAHDNSQLMGHEHSAEHGHSHLADVIKQEFGLRCMLLMIALSVHSFFEGIALGLQDEFYKTVTLFVGIVLHEILVSFAMGLSLAKQNLQLLTAMKICIFYSATIPAGMAIGMAFHGFQSLPAQLTSAIIQGIAAGTFVYVTFLEILPAEINTAKKRLLKVGFMFLGFAFMACLKFSLKEENGGAVYYKSYLDGN
ncbi:hypothetical protein LSH36_218g04010 [Paralvinella palmiformis]|uniref:Zinc transporter ZIP3 n=1 Tax=Paralvinella palmiformis TaxID=53620 RepID=A0AAD9JN93_9ANNE|nr:hypothetical protein LSH36_218g04010 [Paralvinella palmiformis]